MTKVSVVIGSWGSYNECNERALGSDWINFDDYTSWEEIEEELENQGFELNGIDEELFVQDIEGIEDSSTNWDYINPKTLFNLLLDAEVLDNDYKYKVMCAYLEVRSFEDFQELVEKEGCHWDWDITIWQGYDWYDLGYELMHDGNNIPDYLDNYIDYKRFGEELQYDGYHECGLGIIEIR